MEFNYVRKKSVSGSVPDFGAIFMSNRSTKEECFKKKLFGLPPFYADFVKKVKVGMVLFLFEYEQRKLYGVFEATSDGAVNIVPHAYRSSGKQFSAQVRISTIWYCNPLSEHDFHDAIEDNYFAVKKFNFGLSRDQVHRLLWLFDSRKLRIEKTQSLFTESKATEQCRKSLSERRVMKKGRSIAHESISFSEEPESLKISSSSFTAELGDYIPLLSPDDSDSIETGLPFSENNEVESATFIGCKDLSESEMDPMPFLSDALNGGSFRQDVSPESGPCHQDIESSAIAVPLSNVHDCRLKEGAPHLESRGIDCQGHCDSDYNDDYPSVKGLYSDMSERPSVFSRLTLASKTIVQENQDNIRVDISVHKIMEKLQMRHGNWRKKTRKAKPSEHANGANTLKRRTSVFSRLTLASKAIVQEMEDNTQVDKKEHKIEQMLQHYQNHCNKMMGGPKFLLENYDQGENFNKRTHQIEMFNYASPADEEGLDDEWSSERMAKRSPHLTFKRRNKLWKKHRETEGRGFPDSVESNCLFQKQCKRRRLVRPMFRDKSSDIICYSCSNLQMPSQECSAGKKNSGSCEAPNNSERIDDNEDGLSRKDLVPSMKCPITCEGDSREAGGILADDDSNLGELAGAGNCRLSDAAVTKPLKTYRHRRLASLCIKGTDKKIIEDEGKQYLTRYPLKPEVQCGKFLSLDGWHSN